MNKPSFKTTPRDSNRPMWHYHLPSWDSKNSNSNLELLPYHQQFHQQVIEIVAQFVELEIPKPEVKISIS